MIMQIEGSVASDSILTFEKSQHDLHSEVVKIVLQTEKFVIKEKILSRAIQTVN